MPGHISEVTWGQISDEVNRKIGKLVQLITESEALYQRLLRLWAFHGNDNQAVADQLFGGAATPEQLQKIMDLRAAMIAAHQIHNGGNLDALRMMA